MFNELNVTVTTIRHFNEKQGRFSTKNYFTNARYFLQP